MSSSSGSDGSSALLVSSTKEQLVLTGERLFALAGIDGVSLRQIAAEAGAGNNSAVRYHFGSKAALVEAILLYRLPRLTWRRRRLAVDAAEGDLRAALEVRLLPVAELAEEDGSHYLTFLEQLKRFGVEGHPFEQLPPEFQAEHQTFVTVAAGLLHKLPPDLAAARVVQAEWVWLHEAAERERALRLGRDVAPLAMFGGDLLDSLTGFLTAPLSPATRAALTPTRSLRLAGRTSPP